MKRKLIIFISVLLLAAALVSLYGCNSGDSSETHDTSLDGKYYLSLYEEQEPIANPEFMFSFDMPSAIEFTGYKAKLYNSFGLLYARGAYTIDGGRFKTVSIYSADLLYNLRHINSEFKKEDECFYLNYEKDDEVYNFKYTTHPNILSGKYKINPDYYLTERFCFEVITQLEFKGNEVTVTYFDGSEAIYEYEIYGQQIVFKFGENIFLNDSFQIYGYTDEHFFANVRDGVNKYTYYEFIRAD